MNTFKIKSRQDQSGAVYCDGISSVIVECATIEEAQKEVDALECTGGIFVVSPDGRILLPGSPFRGHRDLVYLSSEK